MASFQSYFLQQDESVEEFAYRLRRLLSDAMPNLDDGTAKTITLAQQFVAGLPTAIRQKIPETTENITLTVSLPSNRRRPCRLSAQH